MITNKERLEYHRLMGAGSFQHVRRVMVEKLGREGADSVERRAFIDYRSLAFPDAVKKLVPDVAIRGAILQAHSGHQEARRVWHNFGEVLRRREVNRKAQEVRRVLEEAGEDGLTFSAFVNKLRGFWQRPTVDDMADLRFVEMTRSLKRRGYRIYLREPAASEFGRKGDMSIKRTTRRFKHIEKALGYISEVEALGRAIERLKSLIGETPCALCGQEAPLEMFCFGCLDFLCNICQPSEPEELIVSGPHTLDDHREVAAQVGIGGFSASPSHGKTT